MSDTLGLSAEPAPSPSPNEATPTPPSEGAPQEIVGAQRLRDVVEYLLWQQGLKTAEEVLAAIERYRPHSPTIQRATDVENRVRRMLSDIPAAPAPQPAPAISSPLGTSPETRARGWTGVPGNSMEFTDDSGLEGWKIHPAASLFPLMSDPEMAKLVDDIKRNGLREPITRNWNGKILDGRNRIIACRRAGVELKFVTFDGDEEAEVPYIISKNLQRRHLTVKQRCKLAVRLMPLLEAQAKARQGVRTDIQANLPGGSDFGQARDKAAAMVGVSPRSVQAAMKVERDGVQELKEALDVTVSKAAKIAALSPDEQRAALAAKEFPPPPIKPVDRAALKRATAKLKNGLQIVRESQPQFGELDAELAARVGKAIKVLAGVVERAESTLSEPPVESQ